MNQCGYPHYFKREDRSHHIQEAEGLQKAKRKVKIERIMYNIEFLYYLGSNKCNISGPPSW